MILETILIAAPGQSIDYDAADYQYRQGGLVVMNDDFIVTAFDDTAATRQLPLESTACESAAQRHYRDAVGFSI